MKINMHSPLPRPLLVAALLLSSVLLGCISHGVPDGEFVPAHPNLIVHNRIDGRYQMEILGIVQERRCAAGLEHAPIDFCVGRFSGSLSTGLENLLQRYVQPSDAKRPLPLRARFTLLDFAARLSEAGVLLSMRFQFQLLLPDERPVVEIAETVVGPEPYAVGLDAKRVTGELFNVVLERIGAALERGKIELTPEERERLTREAAAQLHENQMVPVE